MMNQPQIDAIVALLRQQEAAKALRQQFLFLNGCWTPPPTSIPSSDVFMLMASARNEAAFRQLVAGPQQPSLQKPLCLQEQGPSKPSDVGPSEEKADPQRSLETSTAGVASISTEQKPLPDAPTGKKKDRKWLASYENLKKFKLENGNCMVPRGFPSNPHLASWVAEQRKQYKLMKLGRQSSITPERIALLEKLGFAWNAQEAAWEKHMSDLKDYKAQYGDCIVPLNHPKFPKLGLWVKEQRRHGTLMKQGKHSHMTPERARALDEVGFCWDAHEAVWGERLRELYEYKAVHGHCLVPTNWPTNPRLGTWVHHQRRQYKKFKEGKNCHITQERIRVLDSLGFVWSPRERSSASCAPSPLSVPMESRKRAPSPQNSSQIQLEDYNLKPHKRQRAEV